MKLRIFLLAMALSLIAAGSCSKDSPGIYRKTKPLMDTLVTVTVVAGSDKKADQAIEKTFSVIERFGDKIDFFKDTSELSSINRNAGVGPVKVSPETLGVIERAIYIARISEGAFDPTIGPEIKMWDFFKKIRPADDAIRNNLSLVNYRDIVVNRDNATVFLRRKGMLMDLGGIAKGYAADLALADLKKGGISAGIIAAAGEIRAFGFKPDGTPWNIGIKNPRQKSDTDELLAKARLSDKAVSTSGDYERFFVEDGKRYHHILNPKTGYPADQCRSVTVISNDGLFADGFATSLFVLGPDRGMKLAMDRGVDVLIVDKDGVIHTTPGLKKMVTFEDSH